MDKLVATLKLFKNQLNKWQSELNEYNNWVSENNNIDSFIERENIERINLEILSINTRIFRIEVSKKIITLSPEDEIMRQYNEKLIEFQTYFTNITCKNNNGSVVEQKDVDMVLESLKIVHEMQSFYEKNSSAVKNYSWVADFYTTDKFEKRLVEVESWKSKTDERYNDSQLIKDYKNIKKEGPQPLIPPKDELMPIEYHDPELKDDYGIVYSDYNALPLFDSQNGIEETDAIQGNLGDCYAISALSAIAKASPEIIKKNITPLGNNLFEVTLYIREIVDGKATDRMEKKVIVDSDFPVEVLDNGSKKLYYAQSEDSEIWTMIMEKAYAKAIGGFDNLVSSTGEEALSVFTGKSVRNFVVMNKNKFLETLKIDNKFIDKSYTKIEFLTMLAKSKIALFDSSKSVISQNDFILQKNHSCSLNSFDGMTIKLRNPHGVDYFEFDVKEDDVWESFSKIALL